MDTVSKLASTPELFSDAMSDSFQNLNSLQSENDKDNSLIAVFNQKLKSFNDSKLSMMDNNNIQSPQQLLNLQWQVTQHHLNQEILAKVVGKISQNIDTLIKNQ